MWGEERVKDFTRKLVTLGGGWLCYGEEERVVSGEFPILANIGDSLATMSKWEDKSGSASRCLGHEPRRHLLFSCGRAEKFHASEFGETVRRIYGFQRRSVNSR